MTYSSGDKQYTLPDSLSQITLQSRIDYENLYGKELKAQKATIDAMPDGSDKDVESFIWLADSACKAFSFFTGIELEQVRTTLECRQVINVFQASIQQLLIEEMQIKVQPIYVFNERNWIISAPIESTDASINYSQFVTLKQLILDIASFGEGNWEKLIILCVYYFRMEGETFDNITDRQFDFEGRKELLKSLPLDIALTVGIFLRDTMILYLDTLKKQPDVDTGSDEEGGK